MSNKDYSPILCLGAKQITPSLVTFYDTLGKVWVTSIFFVPVLARENLEIPCLPHDPIIAVHVFAVDAQ